MIINAGVLIDFGNSETRVIVISGNKNFRLNLSNKFAELPTGYRVNPKYANGKSSIFLANGVYFANGQIVEREFTNQEIRPSALQSKTAQLVTDLTLNLVFCKALELLGNVYNVAPSSLDVTFNVSALLPPLDHEVNEEVLQSKIKDINSVTALMPSNMQIGFNIGEVKIQSEAVAAFFGAFYKEEGLKSPTAIGEVIVRDNSQDISLVEVDNNKKFMNGYVMVLDIGAGTTDVAIFRDMELVERSKETFKKGGNTVSSIIRQEIRKQYGFEPASMTRVITEGYLEEGVELHDVSDIVTMAKDTYSRALMEDLRQYLERAMIDMPVIKGLLVAGGGALPGVRDGEVVSPAMSDVLCKYLKELAPRLEQLDVDGKDLRELNIEGLMYIHKYS